MSVPPAARLEFERILTFDIVTQPSQKLRRFDSKGFVGKGVSNRYDNNAKFPR